MHPVRTSVLSVALVFAWASAVWAAPPATLTNLRQITGLSNAQAANGLPVAFEATVTYSAGYTLFVQDDGAGIYVSPPIDVPLVPGDRVLVRGKTAASFHPIVVSENTTATKLAALARKQTPSPTVAIRIPAIAGPTERATLTSTELRLTALRRCSGPTS